MVAPIQPNFLWNIHIIYFLVFSFVVVFGVFIMERLFCPLNISMQHNQILTIYLEFVYHFVFTIFVFARNVCLQIDTSKVQMDVIKPWVATRVTELLGFEDEVLINFIYGMLEEKVGAQCESSDLRTVKRVNATL